MGFEKVTSVETPTFRAVEWGDPKHADLLRQFHKLRKDVFVDQLGWDLPVHDGYEWDQYDCPRSTYILTEVDGKCTGGCRLMKTDGRHTVGAVEYSYMLRDAKLGNLPGMPPEMIEDTPSDGQVWEMTRAISGRNPAHFKALMMASIRYMRQHGGTKCLFITRPVVYQLGLIWGFDMEMAGPKTQIGNSKWMALCANIAATETSDPLEGQSV